jgi:large subunit ribosomal protein L15
MRNKTNKQRATRGYGRGRGKSHNRGAGNRGGKGNAGSGKKGDCKKPSYWKVERFGKKAFGMHNSPSLNVINVGEIQGRIEKLIAEGKVKKGTEITLNLTEKGYDKLLGSGSISFKVNISIGFASKSAIEKVESAGGKVLLAEIVKPSVVKTE